MTSVGVGVGLSVVDLHVESLLLLHVHPQVLISNPGLLRCAHFSQTGPPRPNRQLICVSVAGEYACPTFRPSEARALPPP